MGGFYGSIQVRIEDRDRLVRVVAQVATAFAIRCLIGPSIDGWVGIYPEGAGQDDRIGQAIAKEVGWEVLQAVVHDDDVMAYWFWFNGELADCYWSNPGYFNELDQRKQERMSGDPQAFGDAIAKRGKEMLEILERKHLEFTFEGSRLQRFAEFLGITNAVTSYEYLKAGERAGIVGWDEFTEVPAEAVAVEQAIARHKRQQIKARKEQLRRDWVLMSDVVENTLAPKACAIGGGMLVAWEGFGRGEPRVDFFRAPWGDPEPGEIETGGQVNSLSADAKGRRFAMALGNRVVVWEAAGWRPVLELVESEWAVLAALSANGRLLAYSTHAGVFVHEVDSGKRLTALSSHDGKALAFHPSGKWLISAGAAVWIAPLVGKEPWRELYPGGQTPLAPELSQAVKKEMTRIDLDAMEQKWRAAMENAVQKMAASGQSSANTQQLVGKMREQMEKQLEQMRQSMANLKAGKLPPPRHGNESVMCAGFTEDGSKLWLGTDRGLRVYEWSSVQNSPPDAPMPKPIRSHDPDAGKPPGSSHGLVYAAVEIPGKNALLFGGYAGKLCHMDLRTGDVRELTSLPDGGAIVGLTLAADSIAVGICSRPALGENGDKQDERAVWQIWSYPALLSPQASAMFEPAN